MQEALEFLKRCLPKADYYGGGFVQANSKDFKQKVYRSVEEIVRESFGLSEVGINTYFALSGFGQGWHSVTRRGKEKNVFRTQDNAVAQKAFWLDIDAGEGKPYKSKEEANVALLSFVSNTGLPTPTIISSGYGLHVYWILAEQIETKQWELIASWLEALVNHYQLKVDPTRTTDAASVLRVPGTKNYRDPVNPQPVRIIQNSEDTDAVEFARMVISQAKALDLSPIARSKRNAPMSLNSALSHNPALADAFQFNAFKEQPRDALSILKNCKQIRESGRESEPIWFAMMTVIKHCEADEQVVHALSRVDETRYDEDDTQEKYEYVKDMSQGPALCSTFERLCPGKCDDCPYKGKISTPLELGKRKEEEAKPIKLTPLDTAKVDGVEVALTFSDKPEIEIVPFTSKKFAVVPGQGIIYKYETAVEGSDPIEKTSVINDAELYFMCIHVDATGSRDGISRSFVIRKQVKGKPPEDIILPVDKLIGKDSLIKWMANNAILPTLPGYYKLQEEFMATYAAKVQNRLQEVHLKDSFGWTTIPDTVTGRNRDAFIIGSTVYIEDDAPTTINLDDRCAQMAGEYEATGSLEEWKTIVQLYEDLGQYEAQLFICATFAAPLMRFGDSAASNMVMNLYDQNGGIGKSTLFQVCNSVWGHPTKLMLGKADTLSARYQVLSTRKNLPVCMDEMTLANDKDMAELLYDIANGREKKKSKQGGERLAKTGSWQTVTLMNGNRAVYDSMQRFSQQSTAPMMRVMDIHCPFKDYSGTPEGERINSTMQKLRHNYGLAGREFIRRLMQNQHILPKLPDIAMQWDQTTRESSDERFWTYGLGMAITAGRLAFAWGILPFNMDKLEAYAQTLLNRMRSTVKSVVELNNSLFVDFLNDSTGNMLVTCSARRPANKPEPNSSGGVDMWARILPRHKLTIRYELDSSTLYVSCRAVQAWCTRYGYNANTLMKTLQEQGQYDGKRSRVNLGRGCSAFDMGSTQCYVLNAALLDIDDDVFLDDGTEEMIKEWERHHD